MVKYFCEYSILPEHTTRETCMTLFGGMTYDDDIKELGDVKLLGRWSKVGEAKGYCIVESEYVFNVQQWLNSWIPMANINVTPCLDDNEHRELIIGSKSDYVVKYDLVDKGPLEKESLYAIKYKFKEGKKEDGFIQFSGMTEEEDKADAGKCTNYGRWHNPNDGSGFAIASSPDAISLFKWARNWKDFCDVEIYPVTEDFSTRLIIQNSYGFYTKYSNVMTEIAKLEQPNNECC